MGKCFLLLIYYQSSDVNLKSHIFPSALYIMYVNSVFHKHAITLFVQQRAGAVLSVIVSGNSRVNKIPSLEKFIFLNRR